jgi:hypothetical protein
VEIDLNMLRALAGGVEGATEVMGAAWEGVKVGEAGDEGAAQVFVVRPPRVAV